MEGDVLGGIISVDNDNITWSLFLALEVVFKDLLDTRGVSGLGIESSTGHMWDHCVSTGAALVLHGAPGVILGSGLREPDITAVSTEMARFNCLSNI